jgi:hypothetical protein
VSHVAAGDEVPGPVLVAQPDEVRQQNLRFPRPLSSHLRLVRESLQNALHPVSLAAVMTLRLVWNCFVAYRSMPPRSKGVWHVGQVARRLESSLRRRPV